MDKLELNLCTKICDWVFEAEEVHMLEAASEMIYLLPSCPC